MPFCHHRRVTKQPSNWSGIAVGFQATAILVVCIMLGSAVGWFIDQRWPDISQMGVLVGAIVGLIIAVRQILKLLEI